MVEVLRELFGDAVTEDMAARFSSELGKRFVPKNDYNSRRDEAAALKNQLSALMAELAAAKEEADGAEDLRAQLQEMQMQAALDRALRRAGARNETAVKALLDIDAISYVNGVFIGLDEQLAALKASDGYLFEDVQRPAHRTYSKGSFARRQDGMPTREELEHMTYSQMMAAKQKYPNLEL